MLDLKLVRERTDSVRANLERRQDSGKLRLFDELVKDDKRLRELKVQVEALRSERNRLTQEVSQLKKEGQEASRVIAEASRVSEKIKSSELELVENIVWSGKKKEVSGEEIESFVKRITC